VDASVAALLVAGLGVVGTVSAAAVNSYSSARSAARRLTSEAEGKKLDSLQDALDAGGLAIERIHWALREAVRIARRSAGSTPPSRQDWENAREEIALAQEAASSQGTRLAVRLGAKSRCVAAYDWKQERYWELIESVLKIGTATSVDIAAVESDLSTLGRDKRFLNEAAELLRPASAGPVER
jgi:hypothetical protein